MAYTTIDKPSSYFNTVLYTGTGASLSVTGVGFKPDWVWTKGRNVAYSNYLYDSVRGTGNRLISNSTSNEDPSIFGVSSFNSDGFTLGTDVGANNSGSTFVSWNWLAANSTTTNTSGTITSTVSANTTAGFSIVSYTGNGTGGATVGHGLGVTPACFITKCRSNASTPWGMYHQSVGNTAFMELSATSGKQTNIAYFNNTSPTSSVFTIGTDTINNGNGYTFIAYCFAEVKGFSKFGSYTGNGSTDGTFVYTGFKPAFVMLKRTDSTSSWAMYDNKRSTYNVMNIRLLANTTGADDTSADNNIDFVSNGIKFRTSVGWNASGATYIYMAFAENPFVSSTQIPTTAR